MWIENGLWGRKLYSRLPCFLKYLGLNNRGKIELRARKDKHQESLCCAVIRRSAVVGPVPPKILAACALFLRRNHLRLVLFNTWVQSCHEKFVCAHVRMDNIVRVLYPTSNSRECMGINGESLQLHAVYKKKRIFYCKHARIRISTTSHVRFRIRYASHARCIWTCNEIESSYDKIIITILPSYTGKNHSLPLAFLLVLSTRNNTDSNKLVIFFGIASYNGDNQWCA